MVDVYYDPYFEKLVSKLDNNQKEKIKNKEFSDLHKLVPVYLYPKECQVKIA